MNDKLKRNSALLRSSAEFKEALERLRRMANAFSSNANELFTPELTREIVKHPKFKEIGNDILEKRKKKNNRMRNYEDWL